MTSFIGRILSSSFLLLALSPSQPALAQSASWTPVGPDGGDARSFAPDPTDPKHVYLGTTNSWIYQTEDGGASWHTLAKLAKSDDLILDNVVVDQSDPKTLLVGAWIVDHPGGGLFISHDAGKTWTTVEAMKGQSIRAVTQAPSDPKTWIVGTLRGVYRSEDGGKSWAAVDSGTKSSITDLVQLSDGRVFAVALDGVSLTSDDRGHTFKVRQRADQRALTALTISAENPILFSDSGVVKD